MKTKHCIDILNLGASIHMTPYLFCLQNIWKILQINVIVANKRQMTILYKGKMDIKLDNSNRPVSTIQLQNVYYYPHMHFTLISEASLYKEDGYRINKKKNKCIIYKNGVMCKTIIVNNKLYQIITHYWCPCVNLLTIKQLHEKLGHLNFQYLQQILKDTPKLITEKIIDNNKQLCTKCFEANIL